MQPVDNKVWYLSRLNLFASLTDDHIDRVAQSLDDQLLPAGTEILQDWRRERLYIIKTGAVCLYNGCVRTQFEQQCASASLVSCRL